MANKATLCTWFLFHSGLKTSRAKSLLHQWRRNGLTITEALQKLPDAADKLGLTSAEAARLKPPPNLPPVTALCWDDALYPAGLADLPLKQRPALLFYEGERDILRHNRIYLPASPASPEERELLQEAVEVLLGEGITPATFAGSETAEILLEVMATTEGHALLWADRGLNRTILSPQAQKWRDRQRLLIITPLPPGTRHNPAWRGLLHAVAEADAAGCITTEVTYPQTMSIVRPVLLLGGSADQSHPAHVTASDEPLEILFWLPHESPAPPSPIPVAEPLPEYTLTPEETLQLLESGGHVPDVLKARLRKT